MLTVCAQGSGRPVLTACAQGSGIPEHPDARQESEVCSRQFLARISAAGGAVQGGRGGAVQGGRALDYPIGPLGTGLGPRAFRGPQSLVKTNTIAKIGPKYYITSNFSLAPTAITMPML